MLPAMSFMTNGKQGNKAETGVNSRLRVCRALMRLRRDKMTIAEKILALNRAGYRCHNAGKQDMARMWWRKEIELMEKRDKEERK